MRSAIVRAFGGPEVVEMTHTAVPEITADQVLVRNYASGFNPLDTYLRAGRFPVLPKLPYFPGTDGAGVVQKVGANVKNVKVGDRVWYGMESNSAAQYTAVNRVYPLPEGVSFSEGASLGIPYIAAYRALFQLAGAKTGDVILVHGASGGVGSALLQLAAWQRIEAVGTAGSSAGLDFVKRLGAKNAYDHSREDYVCQLKKDYPKGFNFIFEMAAHKNLNADLGLLAPRGKIAVIGNKTETVIDARQLMATEGAIFGMELIKITPAELTDFGKNIAIFLRNTASRPVINKEYPLEKLSEAHKDIYTNSGARGNLVIRVD